MQTLAVQSVCKVENYTQTHLRPRLHPSPAPPRPRKFCSRLTPSPQQSSHARWSIFPSSSPFPDTIEWINSTTVLLLHCFCFLCFKWKQCILIYCYAYIYDISHCKEILHSNHKKRYRSRGNTAETRPRSRNYRGILGPITIVLIPRQPSSARLFYSNACSKM